MRNRTSHSLFRTRSSTTCLCPPTPSERISNGKRKGRGNRKNGNKYLAWGYIEAAHFAVRFNPAIKGYYQRKCARTNRILAIKTVAHKLARACFYILRAQVAFDVNKARRLAL